MILILLEIMEVYLYNYIQIYIYFITGRLGGCISMNNIKNETINSTL